MYKIVTENKGANTRNPNRILRYCTLLARDRVTYKLNRKCLKEISSVYCVLITVSDKLHWSLVFDKKCQHINYYLQYHTNFPRLPKSQIHSY